MRAEEGKRERVGEGEPGTSVCGRICSINTEKNIIQQCTLIMN